MQLKSIKRDQLVRQQELADLLGTTPQTIIVWEREGMKPAYRHGTYVLFDPAACMHWLYHVRKKKRTTPKKWRKALNGVGNGK